MLVAASGPVLARSVVCWLQPAGQSQPEVLCVVSPVQAFSFYDQLLEAAERKRDLSLDHAKDLLQSAYGRPMPGPGKEAWIRAPVSQS